MSRSRAVYTKLESNSEPERARVCQRVAVRARVGVTESHREPERDRERASESLREQVRAKKEASLTFLAYLNIVLLQNN